MWRKRDRAVSKSAMNHQRTPPANPPPVFRPLPRPASALPLWLRSSMRSSATTVDGARHFAGPASCSDSEARHLPVHVRRPVAHRPVRLQAETARLSRAELPASVRMGQRVTGMTSGQRSFPCVAPMFTFRQHGQSGRGSARLLPHIGTVADESPSSSRCTPRRSIMTRPSRTSRPGASSPAGRAAGPGSATASAPRTPTCPRSSS